MQPTLCQSQVTDWSVLRPRESDTDRRRVSPRFAYLVCISVRVRCYATERAGWRDEADELCSLYIRHSQLGTVMARSHVRSAVMGERLLLLVTLAAGLR